MERRDVCGFTLENDYAEDREDRTCQRRVERIVKTTGNRPLISHVCGRCADIIERRYSRHGIEYVSDPI